MNHPEGRGLTRRTYFHILTTCAVRTFITKYDSLLSELTHPFQSSSANNINAHEPPLGNFLSRYVTRLSVTLRVTKKSLPVRKYSSRFQPAFRLIDTPYLPRTKPQNHRIITHSHTHTHTHTQHSRGSAFNIIVIIFNAVPLNYELYYKERIRSQLHTPKGNRLNAGGEESRLRRGGRARAPLQQMPLVI